MKWVHCCSLNAYRWPVASLRLTLFFLATLYLGSLFIFSHPLSLSHPLSCHPSSLVISYLSHLPSSVTRHLWWPTISSHRSSPVTRHLRSPVIFSHPPSSVTCWFFGHLLSSVTHYHQSPSHFWSLSFHCHSRWGAVPVCLAFLLLW